MVASLLAFLGKAVRISLADVMVAALDSAESAVSFWERSLTNFRRRIKP
jgi:hypothetical protein